MPLAIKSNLTWDATEAIQAKDQVLRVLEHPGFEAILEAINMQKVDLTSNLLTASPTDESAGKERAIGEIAGLEQVPLLIQGIIENGEKAEHELRRQE